MPRIPLLDSHGEGVDVLVKKLEKTDRLNDGLVLPVDVEGNFISGESMGKTKSWLLQFYILEILMLEEVEEMLPDSPDDLIDDGGGRGLDLEGFVDGACNLVFADTQLDLRLFLDGEEFRDEVDQIFRRFSFESAVDYGECFFGGFEGQEGLDIFRGLLWAAP